MVPAVFVLISYDTEKKEVIEYHIKADKWPFHTHLGVSFSLICQGHIVIVRLDFSLHLKSYI